MNPITYIEGMSPTYVVKKDNVEAYPPLLARTSDAPESIYITTASDPAKILDGSSVVAIVGTRHSTVYGQSLAWRIVQHLARGDDNVDKPVIVSALQSGIDAAVLEACLSLGLRVVAVTGAGPDVIQPTWNLDLARRIAATPGCAIIARFDPETTPSVVNDIQSLHVVAGLADTTVVVESMAKGSAMVVAKLARSYGREVYAVPGRLKDVTFEGCNILIGKHEARLVYNIDEFLVY